MTLLPNYVAGQWLSGSGPGQPLSDPVLGHEVARVSAQGVDYAKALQYSRAVGGPALRGLTYGERAAMLGQIAAVLTANRDEYYRISLENSGSTKGDAAFDVDGAIFTLKYYARFGSVLGDARTLRDGDATPLSRDGAFQALHLAQPLRGAAILINAYNFPAWGLWEKAAAAFLSGVPVFVKPATATAWLAQRMVHHLVEANAVPEGALSIVCGSAGDLLDHVTAVDVVAFTGSAVTAALIRTAPGILRHSARVNVEADSLNVAVLGPDAQTDSEEFALLVREVTNEMTVKAGQKCTAIRRVLVPAARFDDVRDALRASLDRVTVGNPRNPDVRMGPLVSKEQQRAVQEGLSQLRQEATVVFGGDAAFVPLDADPSVGAFVPPTLLASRQPLESPAIHEVEVFGPVATVMPYDDFAQAIHLAGLAGGSLVASVFTADHDIIDGSVDLSSLHGRVHIVNGAVGKTQTGHGNVMPMSQHGGPGRAGGGHELGGLRALRLYHGLSVIQGPAEAIEDIARRTSDCRF